MNGKGDRDSGHGEMSDTNSDIETVISSVSHNSQDSRFLRERLSRSNSDFAAPLSQREKTALRDTVIRSRSIDQTRIQASLLLVCAICMRIQSASHGSYQGALASTTGVPTTSPQIENLIGRTRKYKRVARAARAFEQFGAVLCKTTT